MKAYLELVVTSGEVYRLRGKHSGPERVQRDFQQFERFDHAANDCHKQEYITPVVAPAVSAWGKASLMISTPIFEKVVFFKQMLNIKPILYSHYMVWK